MFTIVKVINNNKISDLDMEIKFMSLNKWEYWMFKIKCRLLVKLHRILERFWVILKNITTDFYVKSKINLYLFYFKWTYILT